MHNRAGEYFYTAACGYHFVKTDETFSAVFPNLVIGVNDKTNRAALGGRYQSSSSSGTGTRATSRCAR